MCPPFQRDLRSPARPSGSVEVPPACGVSPILSARSGPSPALFGAPRVLCLCASPGISVPCISALPDQGSSPSQGCWALGGQGCLFNLEHPAHEQVCHHGEAVDLFSAGEGHVLGPRGRGLLSSAPLGRALSLIRQPLGSLK